MNDLEKLKKDILNILAKAADGKVLTAELLELTKGGAPVCILLCETQSSIDKMQKAISELLDEEEVLLNPQSKPDKHIKLSNEVKERLKQCIGEVKNFLSDVVIKNPAE